MQCLTVPLYVIGLLIFLISRSIAATPPTPPTLKAQAYILQDFHSSQRLMQKNSAKRLEPASLTKLMTAYIVFQALHEQRIKLEDKVRISEKAWRMPGSRMYLEVDTEVSVEQLLKGMIIQSGNDASIALAEHVASSEETFVDLMNKQAQQWELKNTHYANTTGLPNEQHYTSAEDLVKVAQKLIQDFPEYYRWYSEKQFTYNGITQQNRNPLLKWSKNVDGMKTGYTEGAGYCLLASALRGKMRLIAIVLGESSQAARSEEMKKMLNYGFQFFETYLLYQAKQTLTTERIWYGAPSDIQLGLQESFYVTLVKGQYALLKVNTHINRPITAPTTIGQVHGKLQIELADKLIAEKPLTALHAVEEAGLMKQLVDHLWLQFH